MYRSRPMTQLEKERPSFGLTYPKHTSAAIGHTRVA